MKKIVWPGLLSGLAMLAIGALLGKVFGFLFPAILAEYANPQLFRPWSDPLMSLYFLEPFVLGIILAWLWGRLKGSFNLEHPWKRIFGFGLMYWIIGIPGMIMSYGSFPVSFVIVLSWSLTLLVQAVVAAWIFARLVK